MISMAPEEMVIFLSGGAPWGFRLQGGIEHQRALQVAKVRKRSKACRAGLHEGDELVSINENPCGGLTHAQAMTFIDSCPGTLQIKVKRVPAGFQSVVLLPRAPSPRIDREYRATRRAMNPTSTSWSQQMLVSQVNQGLRVSPSGAGRPRSGLTSPPGSEAYYGETDSDADVVAKERQRRQKRRSPSHTYPGKVGHVSSEGGETSEMSGYDSASDPSFGVSEMLSGMARCEVTYQPPPPSSWSSQTSTETSSASTDDQNPKEGRGFLDPPTVPLVSRERAKGALMLSSHSQLVPMVGPVDMPVDEELTVTYMDKAKQAKLTPGDKGQIKEARNKCRTIASLLTDAQNPHSRGVLMFKKRRQRSKKYTLTSYGSVDEDVYQNSFEEDCMFPGSESEFDEDGFSAAPDPTWDNGYLDMLEKRTASLVACRKENHAPGLIGISGKGAQLFEQQRKRAEEYAEQRSIASGPNGVTQAHSSLSNIPSQFALMALAPDKLLISTDVTQATPTLSISLLTTSCQENLVSSVLNRTARPFTPGFISNRAATAPVVFRPPVTKKAPRPISVVGLQISSSVHDESSLSAVSFSSSLSAPSLLLAFPDFATDVSEFSTTAPGLNQTVSQVAQHTAGQLDTGSSFSPMESTVSHASLSLPATTSFFTPAPDPISIPSQVHAVVPLPKAISDPKCASKSALIAAPSDVSLPTTSAISFSHQLTVVSSTTVPTTASATISSDFAAISDFVTTPIHVPSAAVTSFPPLPTITTTAQVSPQLTKVSASVMHVSMAMPSAQALGSPVQRLAEADAEAPSAPFAFAPFSPQRSDTSNEDLIVSTATPVEKRQWFAPESHTGILEAARRQSTGRHMFNMPKGKKTSPNPTLLSMVQTLDERPSQRYSAAYQFEEDEVDTNIQDRIPPPVAPKPRVIPEVPQILWAEGKGAELFARRQSRVDQYVVDSVVSPDYSPQQVSHSNRGTTRDSSPTKSLPLQWKYSPNVRAPPPIGYNPLFGPCVPMGPQRDTIKPSNVKKDERNDCGLQREGIKALDFLRGQPYKLNSAMFGGAPSSTEPPHHKGFTLTLPQQIPIKASCVYEIKRFSTPTPISAKTVVPKVIGPRSVTTLGGHMSKKDMTSQPHLPLSASLAPNLACSPVPALAPIASTVHLNKPPKLSKISTNRVANANPSPFIATAPISSIHYSGGLRTAKQFKSAPDLRVLPSIKPAPIKVPEPHFVAAKVGIQQAHVWRPANLPH